MLPEGLELKLSSQKQKNLKPLAERKAREFHAHKKSDQLR
jgi:hypothetical protein